MTLSSSVLNEAKYLSSAAVPKPLPLPPNSGVFKNSPGYCIFPLVVLNLNLNPGFKNSSLSGALSLITTSPLVVRNSFLFYLKRYRIFLNCLF